MTKHGEFKFTHSVIALLLAPALVLCAEDRVSRPIIVADGLAITPFAVEELSNPCSIDVDDRGRVWVGEAVNYRKKSRKEGDRILILEDADKDGRPDLTKVFYQNPDIDGVHGVCVLGNKVVVSAPDRILVLTDTNGDDKADKKKLLFMGKVLHPVHGQHDHAIHAVMSGPDGRLYFNFGNFNAELRREDGSLVKDIYGLPVNNSRQPYQEGMVIRCEMDGSRVEVLGHNFRNNWEVAVDSFGSMWQSDNDNGSSSCRVNFVMEHGNYGYRDERTGADYRQKRTNLETTMQRQMWHQNDPGVMPNLLITGFGAPTGILVYEGDLLPKQFHGQMIHAEPGRNTVWAFPTRQDGAGYSAEIVHVARSEADRNYRPCDVSVAPDGSLLIADWYDPVDCCHRTLNDAGRLFRVAPPGHVYSTPTYNYDIPEGAVTALRSPNLAARYKAWAALLRTGAAARPALRTLLQNRNTRLRARGLWVLAAIDDTPEAAIEIALRDESDNIRALALRIARRHQLPVEAIVKRLVNDKSALVRRECAVSLHRLDSADAAELWAELALQYDGKDRWYLEALGIGEVGNETACLDAWRKRVGENWKATGHRDIVWRSRAPEAATLLAELLLDANVPATEHPRLLRALDFHDGQQKQAALMSLLTADPKRNPVVWLEAFQRASPDFLKAQPDISKRAGSVMLSSKGTVTFVDLVARFNRRDMVSHLMDMAAKAPESEAGIRAVSQIIAFEDWDPIWKALADPTRSKPFITALGYVNSVHAKNYLTGVVTNESQPEAIRLLAISAMGNSGPQAQELKRLVEQKKLPQEFLAPAIRALTLSPNPDTRMFAASRQNLIISAAERWPLEKLLAGKPDPTKGFAAFQKGGCIKCHKIGIQGREFGPDLSAIGKKLTATQLFSAILKPSETISLGYESVSVLTDDGKLYSGFVAAETNDTLTLRVPGGLTAQIPKATIELRKCSNVSLMPKGIDAILSPQELIDVVGWLKTQQAAIDKSDAEAAVQSRKQTIGRQAESRPNIVLFLVDDMGVMDTSVPMLTDANGKPKRYPWNDWYRTPNMERLAAKGVRFSNFYSHNVCSPTRVSIMSGQNSARHRCTDYIFPWKNNRLIDTRQYPLSVCQQVPPEWNWVGLKKTDVTLPKLLKEVGYKTIHVGKAHFAPDKHTGTDPRNLGFDVNIAGSSIGAPGSYYAKGGFGRNSRNKHAQPVPGLDKYHGTDTFLTEALTLEAIAEVDKALGADKPFFLYMSHYAVHSPFNSDPRFAPNYRDKGKPPAAQAYATLIEGMDKSLGDLMDHVEAKGVAENTLFIFLGDNGGDCPYGPLDDVSTCAPLRGRKGAKWEGGMRVPFIVAWAKPEATNAWQKQLPIPAGSIRQVVGACYDLFPTIVEFVGVQAPADHHLDGQNLAPFLSGRSDPQHQNEFLNHYPHPRRGQSHFFTTWREGNWKIIYQYLAKDADRYALYDLANDPSESNNVAAEQPGKLRSMMQGMVRQLKSRNAVYPAKDGQTLEPVLPQEEQQ